MSSDFVPGHIARSGWLMRQTSVLRRWKKSFVVFYTDGRLAYFDSETTSVSEDVINIPCDKAVILGPEYCKEVTAPEEKLQNFLFGVKTQKKSVYFCADNADELMAWKFALQEAFNIQVHQRHIGPAQYNQFTYYVPPGSTIVVDERGPAVYQPNGKIIYVCEEPYFRNYGYGTGDFCTGMLAGAALGTFMFWPWWFFWI